MPTSEPIESASPTLEVETEVASAGEGATAGMKRKDPPPTTSFSSSMTLSSLTSSLRTSTTSSISTLNNRLPTPTNLSTHLLQEIDTAANLSTRLIQEIDTELYRGENAITNPTESVGAEITVNSPTEDVVQPKPTLIDKAPSGGNSPIWSFFKLFDPDCHPDLEKYAQCTLCNTKISRGNDSSTSGMNRHLMFKHIDVYKRMLQEANQNKTKSEAPKITTHFKVTDKKSDKEMKQLFTVAAATCAATNGLPLDLFTSPSFRNMFGAISRTADRVVNISSKCLRKEVLTLGLIAEDAVRAELRGKRVSYTSDHWTGPNDETYTTVTAHFIETDAWEMRSLCIDFKVFSGRTTGEKIYNDIQAVLKKFMGASDFVQDTIGITDTTGNMGKLGKFLRESGHEHAYCTDHVFHLTASLAFGGKLLFGKLA
jgi:hypothetical protein